MHVLVHIDQGLGPIGAWGYNGKLRHFYPESLDVAISSRARERMAERDTDISIPDWMEMIAETEPNLLDQYCMVEALDTETLPSILAQFRRHWNAT